MNVARIILCVIAVCMRECQNQKTLHRYAFDDDN